MSQLNVNTIRHSSGTGSGVDLQSSGNIAFDTSTLYVDSVNDRIGINTAAPGKTLDVSGTNGVNLGSGLLEGMNVRSGLNPTSVANIDLLTSSIDFYTANGWSGNWTQNLRGDSSTTLDSVMPVGTCTVYTAVVALGSSSGYTTSIQIDGTTQTIYWVNDSTPSRRGGDSGYDMYQYTIIRTSTSATGYLIFGTQSYLG